MIFLNELIFFTQLNGFLHSQMIKQFYFKQFNKA